MKRRSHFDNLVCAKRNQDHATRRGTERIRLKPRRKRYVSYGSKQIKKFPFDPLGTWHARERRRLRRRKHGWK